MNTSRNPFLDLPDSPEPSVQQGMGRNILEGIKQGAADVGDMGNKAWLNVAKWAGADKNLPVRYDDYKQFSDSEAKAFDQSPAGQSMSGKAARFGTNVLPYAVVPGGIAGGIGKRMLTGAVANSGIGLVSDIADNNSELTNTKLGAFTGGLIPPALAGAAKVGTPAYNFLFPKHNVLNQVANSVDDVGKMIATKEAGQAIGQHLTPAEASGNQFLAQIQGRLGINDDTAKALQRFGEQHTSQQKSAIGSLLDDISPVTGSASSDIRNAAQRILKGQEQALSKKASPIYQQAYQDEVPQEVFDKLMQNKRFSLGVKNVLSDPDYSQALADVNPRSIQFLDAVKKQIGDAYESVMSPLNPKKWKGSLIQNTQKNLLNQLDEVSPAYKEARAIYGEGASPLESLKNSQLGQIANLKDTQLKRVPNMIFDPAQTDIKVMKNLRDQITKQNPDAWRQGIRNYMDSKLNKTMNADTGQGNNFYNQFLSGDKEFNQLLQATKNIPGAQKKLIDMRATFKNLINPVTPQTAARLARSSLDVSRSTWQSVKDFAANMLGGRYDKAWVEFITNPDWDKQLNNYMKAPTRNVYEKAIKFGSILGKVNTSMNVEKNNNRYEDQPIPRPTLNMKNPFLSLPDAE
jgi:hypothetical protein